MASNDRLIVGDDGRLRCFWQREAPEYRDYHDREWGRPTADDVRLFEKICLEGFQSGLSWLTILRKRENFRRAFAGFDVEKVARFGAKDVTRLLGDAGIIRHRGKIESTINRQAIVLKKEAGSLAAHLWRFEPRPETRPATFDWKTLQAMSKTDESIALSKDLKKR
ncbi:MAG: DNA-3-methyladenine glycosylase I, partial [Planctomycetota bacterium]